MSSWCANGPPGASYDVSDSGWMEGENFYQWFVKYFIPRVQHLSGFKLLFLDGHASHITLKLIDKAIEHNIILYKLAAHTSHLYQPLDVAVFGPAKTHWRQALDTHCKANNFRDVAKHSFPALMNTVVDKAFTKENARAGFEASGLWPLNRDRIANEKLQIGSVFGFTAESDPLEPEALVEMEMEMEQENVSPSISSRTPITSRNQLSSLTPISSRTPKNKLTLEESLKGIKRAFHNATNAASEKLCASVLDVMVKSCAKAPKPAQNVRMESNHCMTGEEVRQILFDKQVAAETEKKRIETNKAERAKKKLDKENAAETHRCVSIMIDNHFY